MHKATLRSRFLIAVSVVMLGLLLSFINSSTNMSALAETEAQDEYVAAYAQDRNITLEEARTRIGWQEKAAELSDRLTEILPKSDYGGIWIDGSTGRIKVGSTETAPLSNEALQTELGRMDLSGAVDIVPVTYSQEILTETTLAIHRLHQELVANKEWPIQMGPKIDQNKVQVDIPKEEHLTPGHYKVLSVIEEKYKDQVFFETYDTPPQEEACNAYYCSNPLRGGVGIEGSVSDLNIDCTAGPLLKRPSTGKVYILTAGHCLPAGNSWTTKTNSGTTMHIGTITNSLYNNASPIDAMIINTVNTDFASKTGKIFKREGDAWSSLPDYNEIPPVYDDEYDMATHSTSVVGERICISPAITGGAPGSEPRGGSCGEVEQTSVMITTQSGITTLVHRAGYCSRGGDSGSPIFASSNKVKGIHRAADTNHGVCSHKKYYTPIATILIGFSNEGIGLEVW